MNEVKEILPCREYFQELKDNILMMFPDKTETQIAVYESWFNEGVRAAHEWHPIETAPKDGTHILIFCKFEDCKPGTVFSGWWTTHKQWSCFLNSRFTHKPIPTHWMALPNPPND